jgi:hypothetical protein
MKTESAPATVAATRGGPWGSHASHPLSPLSLALAEERPLVYFPRVKFPTLFFLGLGLMLMGCASRPSIEKQTREAYQERDEIRAQNDFVKNLKPDQTPRPAPDQ